MATKKKKTLKRSKKAPAIDKEELHLLTLIGFSERAKDGSGGSLDVLFSGQVDKLKKQLADHYKAAK